MDSDLKYKLCLKRVRSKKKLRLGREILNFVILPEKGWEQVSLGSKYFFRRTLSVAKSWYFVFIRVEQSTLVEANISNLLNISNISQTF